MNATTQCPHVDLDITINNASFGNTNLHYLEITASCQTCGKPMVFRSDRAGMQPNCPTRSLDGREVIIPFLGDGEELLGSPTGYSVSAVVSEAGGN